MKIKNGFTLLETLLAMAFLATALLLLANASSGAAARVNKTQTNFELASLLERKMGEIDRLYKEKPLSEIPEEKEDDFGDIYPKYSWKLKSRKFEFPDIASTLSAKEGGVDAMTLSLVKQMTDQISKSVKEVSVTVIFKGPKKNIEVSATTYFIDFDKGISMGMPQ